MDVELQPLIEWQKQAHELINTAFRNGKRLIMLNCGRRSGKSDCLAKWAIVWERGILADGHIAYCAPSEDHYAEVKRWIRNWLGNLITGPSPGGLGFDFVTGGRLNFFSLGSGAVAPMRGLEFQAVIIDEAAHLKFNLIGLLESNIMPTLALTGGPVILASTPKGIANDYHTLWRRAGREGARFSGPSTMNPNFSVKELERQRKTLPELVFRQEFLSEFLDAGGAILKRNEIQVGKCPPREDFESLVMGIDFALQAHERADQTAICIAGVDRDKRTWVIACYSWRDSWPGTLARTLNYIQAWTPALVVMEEVAFQTVVVHQLVDCGVPLLPLKTNKSKTERFGIVHVQYNLGRIFHSDTLSDEFTNQLLAFPEGKPDDMVDSLTYAVAGLNRGIRAAWASNEAPGAQWNALGHEKPQKMIWTKDAAFQIVNGRIQKFDYDGKRRIY